MPREAKIDLLFIWQLLHFYWMTNVFSHIIAESYNYFLSTNKETYKYYSSRYLELIFSFKILTYLVMELITILFLCGHYWQAVCICRLIEWEMFDLLVWYPTLICQLAVYFFIQSLLKTYMTPCCWYMDVPIKAGNILMHIDWVLLWKLDCIACHRWL